MNDKIMVKRDIVIIGGGPAGLAAALAAKKEGAESILILERDKELGGILNQCIHNGFWPSYISGGADRTGICGTFYPDGKRAADRVPAEHHGHGYQPG